MTATIELASLMTATDHTPRTWRIRAGRAAPSLAWRGVLAALDPAGLPQGGITLAECLLARKQQTGGHGGRWRQH